MRWGVLLVAVMWAGCKPEPEVVAPVEYEQHTDLELPLDGGEVSRVPDPTVIKVKNTYYLYGEEQDQVHCWSSTDLKSWEHHGVAWQLSPGTWTELGRIWAPHVQATEEGYYLYFTANGRVGVAFSAKPEGPFVDVFDHPLVGGGYGGVGDGVYESSDYDVAEAADFLADAEEYAIDASLLEAEDGSLTLYFAMMAPLSVVAAVPMSDYTTVSGPPTIVIDADPAETWESINREGPFVVEKNGAFHLYYAGNLWWSVDYAVGEAVSDSPLGPFVRNPNNPILSKNTNDHTFGPGQPSVVPGLAGDELMFFHVQQSATEVDRTSRYAVIEIDEYTTVSP